MMLRYFFPIALFLSLLATGIMAQTPSPWASPGLRLGAMHYNYYDGTRNTSYRYVGDTVLCGAALLHYENMYGNPVYLRVDGGKLYVRYSVNLCSDWDLLYNFDLNVGQGFQNNFSPALKVVEKGQITLLNGQTRRWMKLVDVFNGYNIEWIEGIGDIERGLTPDWGDFEGYDIFSCARDATGDLWLAQGAEGALCDSLTCPWPKPAFVVANNDGATVDFMNMSRDGVNWVWDFGDGSTSTEWQPEHTYAAPGCYDVCLSLSSDCMSPVLKVCHPVAIDQERHWKKLPFPASDQGGILSVSFPHPDTGWVLQSKHIWKTTDGGQTWEEQSFPPNPPGVTRTLLSLRMTTPQLGIVTAGNYVSGPGTSPLESSIMVTTDGGASWQDRNQGDHAFIFDGVLRTDGRGYTTHSFGSILTTDDFGEHWSEVPLGNAFWVMSRLYYWQNDTIVGSGQLGLAPNYTPAIIRSFDGGNTWEQNSVPNWTSGTRNGYFLSGTDGWLTGIPGSVLATDDAGQSWTGHDYPAAGNATDIAFADSQNGWAVGGAGMVVHTTDGGATWERENCGFEDLFTALDVVAPDAAYAGSSAGEVFAYCTGSCMSVVKTRSKPLAEGGLLIYPNPAIATFNVDVLCAGRLTLCDQFGRIVFDAPVVQGTQSVAIDQLSPGVWWLRLTMEDGSSRSGKVVIQP